MLDVFESNKENDRLDNGIHHIYQQNILNVIHNNILY